MPGLPDLRDSTTSEADVRAALRLQPHPEGGHYRELWNPAGVDGSRGAASSILFLLAAGEHSHWHRVDATEIWIWQGGAPLRLGVADTGGHWTLRLGPNLNQGEVLQGLVPDHAWQEACSLGAWTLVSCIVAPAFHFGGFELAPPDWQPPGTNKDEAWSGRRESNPPR